MATIDFTAAYRDATQGSTLKALAARRAEMQAANAAMKPREVKSPWQGAANIADTISGAIREGRIANQEAAGRARFAELLAGGLAPDEIGEAMGLDPDTTMKYQERTWAQEDTKAERVYTEGRDKLKNDWDVAAAAARAKEARDLTEQQDRSAAARQDDQQEATRILADDRATNEQKQHAQEVLDNAEAEKLKVMTTRQTSDIDRRADAEIASKQAAQDAAMADPVAKVKLAMQTPGPDGKPLMSVEEGNAEIAALQLKKRLEGQAEGSKARDRDVAKDVNDWQNGGQNRLVTNLAQVQKSINLLNEPGALSGVPVVGGALQAASDWAGLGKTGALTNLLPESVQPMLNEKGLIARDSIRSAVQESLKAVLGTQFAAIEGENLMDRAFSMSLGTKENADRATTIMNQLSTMAKNKQAIADYFVANNTMEGYTGPPLDVDGVINQLRSMANNTPDATGNEGGGGTTAAPGDPLAEARAAIAKGADPAAVKKRLQENGVDPTGL